MIVNCVNRLGPDTRVNRLGKGDQGENGTDCKSTPIVISPKKETAARNGGIENEVYTVFV